MPRFDTEEEFLSKKRVGYWAASILVFLSGFGAGRFYMYCGETDWFRFIMCIVAGASMIMLGWYNATQKQ